MMISNRELCALKRHEARYRIREVLDAKEISCAELGRRIGVSGTFVSRVIYGKSHSQRVLNALRELGVPEKYLFDPRSTNIEGVRI